MSDKTVVIFLLFLVSVVALEQILRRGAPAAKPKASPETAPVSSGLISLANALEEHGPGLAARPWPAVSNTGKTSPELSETHPDIASLAARAEQP